MCTAAITDVVAGLVDLAAIARLADPERDHGTVQPALFDLDPPVLGAETARHHLEALF
jgi:hypothetical protein